MTTFDEWLAGYTRAYGCPPAHVMAEAAWKMSKRLWYAKGYVDGHEDTKNGVTVDGDLPMDNDPANHVR